MKSILFMYNINLLVKILLLINSKIDKKITNIRYFKSKSI